MSSRSYASVGWCVRPREQLGPLLVDDQAKIVVTVQRKPRRCQSIQSLGPLLPRHFRKVCIPR